MIRLSELIIVAGPNGSGKTTFARQFLPPQMRSYTFVNADEIARRMERMGTPRTQVDLRAGREMLSRIRHAIAVGEDTMVETTLAGASWARHIPDWQLRGYRVCLHYLRLSSPDVAIARVRRRVAMGGHDVPESVIRRRFGRSLVNLDALLPIVDEWFVYDSIDDAPPSLAGLSPEDL